MLVMKINKELETRECIEYAKMLSEYIGEKVVILDSKVLDFYRFDSEDGFSNRKVLFYGAQDLEDDTVQLQHSCYVGRGIKDGAMKL